jgi:branched-chain amino acid transport system substrate-binding protein
MTFGRSVPVKALAAVGVASLALAACSSSSKSSTSSGSSSSSSSSASSGTSAPAAAGTTLKIGFFGALTGPNAQLGINIKNGEELAISQYNATNPAVKVALDPFDSQGKPDQANNGATKLISDKVVAVLGPAFSGESAAADPIFEAASIPNMTASATNVKLATHGWKFFHRALASDDVQGNGDAGYLVKTLGLRTVAVIDDSSTYGEGLANVVRATIASNGAQNVLNDHIDPNGADYGSTVNKIVASKAAGMFFGGYYDAAGRLINQLRSAGYKGVFMSGDGSEDPHFIKDAGGAPAENAYLSCACADATKLPGAQAFVSAYRAAFGTPPEIYSGEAYDATNFLLAAIKSGATTPTAINTYLATNSYTGVTKTIKFLPNGNVNPGQIYVYQVKNGQIVQLGTTS